MLQATQIEGTTIYCFDIDETIKSEQMEMIGKVLDEHTKGGDFKLMVSITGFSGFDDFKAFKSLIVVKFKALLVLKNLKRYALLTDKFWLETLITLEDSLIPSVPIKSFPISERDKALDWLKEEA